MKIHSRRKRAFGRTTGLKNRFFFHKVQKKYGSKTFNSEDAAKGWATERGMEKYEIVPAKKTRFKITV